VLLCYISHRDDATVAVGNGFSEYALALVDAERVMPQCPVPEVAELLFANVEPPVYRSVIVYLSAEAADR
jgi:hypothetical protein